MTARRPLPPNLPSEFSVRAARDAGVARNRLYASDLHRPYRGLRSRDVPHDSIARARAYLPSLPEGATFSHHTAAQLWGMPIESGSTHVTVLQPANRPRAVGVTGHRAWGPLIIRTRQGLPVTTPERTWTDLAAVGVDERTLVVIADHLVRRKRPLCTVESLALAVSRLGNRRGSRSARRALARARRGTDSPPETIVRLEIVESGLPEPRVGHRVVHLGEYIGTPDLAYPELRIAIEYEGEEHQRDRETYLADIERREAFVRAGWTVILVTKEHLRSAPELWLRRIRHARSVALAARVAT
jgi:very-short-patch-repair endonuclease